LDACLLGKNHIALRFKTFGCDYRKYLENHRDASEIGKMLQDVVSGIKELHAMGYVHRDLKPENILVNMDPVKAIVIDFNRATS
jgi:serine/threonine protein kinase